MGKAESFGGAVLQFVHEAYTCNLRPELKYFNHELFNQFNPDINGYVLIFFVPPPFTLLPDSETILTELKKFITFAAVDFTPPQIEIVASEVSGRSGGVPFASELSSTPDCSVTYLDNDRLSIYSFHSGWIEYIHGLVNGIITGPNGEFPKDLLPDEFGNIKNGLDYVGSFFIVKYNPSMDKIVYVSKCTGVWPRTTPSKELIGQRTSNELVTLPYQYKVTKFEEALSNNHPIWMELEKKVLSVFGDV